MPVVKESDYDVIVLDPYHFLPIGPGFIGYVDETVDGAVARFRKRYSN